jgi:hypothetical protein
LGFFYFFRKCLPCVFDGGARQRAVIACTFNGGARQRLVIAVRFLPAHGKGRNTPFGPCAVRCFFLPCASPWRTAKIVHRALSDMAHGNGTLLCKMLPCAIYRAFLCLCHAPLFPVVIVKPRAIHPQSKPDGGDGPREAGRPWKAVVLITWGSTASYGVSYFDMFSSWFSSMRVSA